MDSPPKRRRVGRTPDAAVDAERGLATRGEARSPGRPSFQSPTRSSLAKSHPDVLERALSKSPSRQPTSRGNQSGRSEGSDPSNVGLRDRKALRPSLNLPSSPLKAARLSAEVPMLSPSRRASGVQAFSKPPRRLSKKINPADFTFGSPIRQQISPTHLSNTPEGQLALELGSATKDAEIEANLDVGLDDPFVNEDLLEPDLPPTPTQLGLEKAPDRPRGPLSSSPSTRQEQRMKRRATDTLRGSPLKSLKFQPSNMEVADDTDLALDEVSTAVLQKRDSRKRLTAELRQLKEDVAELTKWTGRVESRASMGRDTKELKRFLTLLSEESSHIERQGTRPSAPLVSSLLSTLLPFSSKVSRPTREASPLPTNPFALKEPSQSPEYLTVFAPLVLHAKTSRTSSHMSAILETHTLTFSAPPPFPASIFNVTVVYETNPETQSMISLSASSSNASKKRKMPEALRLWIDSRLANPLLRLDVATLCWGINRHWEVSVARARLWARIEHNHVSPGRRDVLPQMHDGTISISELRHLTPHLERSMMVVGPKTSKAGPQVLLSNVLTIDEWTGEPQLRSEISVSVPYADGVSSQKVDHEAKKLFHALLRGEGPAAVHGLAGVVHTDAIFRATEGVLGALFGNA